MTIVILIFKYMTIVQCVFKKRNTVIEKKEENTEEGNPK